MRNVAACAVVALLATLGNALAKEPEPSPKEVDLDLGNGVKLEMVLIPAGEFIMGDDKGYDNEKPAHRVKITRPFYLAKYEVTQQQWQALMGANPSTFKDPKNPVERVSWNDLQAFLFKLNEKAGGHGGKFVLPTEAQWEYACRAGSTTRYYFGDSGTQLGEYAWYYENAEARTHAVGQKKPNAWGLFDMLGNVGEWCADGYDQDYYKQSPAADPTGRFTDTGYVSRGGSRITYGDVCRSAYRDRYSPVRQSDFLGFRPARVAAE